MTNFSYPTYVDGFIQMTEECLEHFDMKLELKEENENGEIRSYELIGSSMKTIFIVHQTSRSIGNEVQEYRARMWTEIPSDLGSLLNGKDAQLNRFATLGAVISNETGADVCAQCLIDPSDTGNLAGLSAAGMVQGAQSVIHSVGSVLGVDNSGDNAVHELSAWGDLDFEQIQYDYAHIGTGTHDDKEWKIRLNMRHSLTLAAVQNNPFFGGGLLCLLWVPKTEFGENDDVLSIQRLNHLEHLFGEAPTFGGWCDDGENYVFTSFFPNYLKSLNGITDSIINWAIIRSRMIETLVEVSAAIGDE